ncbi:hypothetical protein GY45DRAFT_1073044 [Cubamyces sp. BRFM 1775]|nr:hypothetical protein GY45DRAFT_1073044 [Cubamyces sp. BRFM 1775]
MFAEFEGIAKTVRQARTRSFAALIATCAHMSDATNPRPHLVDALSKRHNHYSLGLRPIGRAWRYKPNESPHVPRNCFAHHMCPSDPNVLLGVRVVIEVLDLRRYHHGTLRLEHVYGYGRSRRRVCRLG